MTTHKRGRPRSTRAAVINLIGTSGLYALEENDLFVVSGAALRELSSLLREPTDRKAAAESTPTDGPTNETQPARLPAERQ